MVSEYVDAGADAILTECAPMPTTKSIMRYARWLEELSPGLLREAIKTETGEDYRERDLLDLVAKLVEIFGLAGAAEIVGCPR